ncbi:helix-turn-helix domain-containing protein [Paenibacillus tyrfis]|uniref:helix-turn-helix domain-containing protein n=1 Tax=Paenibacillus tyrfis TaxID=1501230 RepID=UPI0020A0CC8E|nr:helix-turn-helix domain-containing protein [Paenibacillus tyrfis]MCP1311660.1 response regulator [Paenibacillus tyrfis]
MKILIVDDEVIIRNGLCTVIDWKELGLTLLPPASSAEEALARIPVEKPNILLTDIRMQGMDGIQLAHEVKRLLPDTETVILTGYDDFAYAQQALREGVTDYLLKTSRPEEIIKAAMKAKQRIMDKWENAKQETMQTAALRSQLLDRLLIQGDESSLAPVQAWFRKNGVQPDESSLAPMRVLLLAATGWGDGALAGLLLGAAENMLYELLPAVTMLKADRIVLVVREEARVSDCSGLERAIDRVRRTLKCTVFAALGRSVASYGELQASYREAGTVFAYRGLLGAEGLYTSGDIADRCGGRTVCSQKEESELAAILMSNNGADLRHWVNRKVREQLEDPAAIPSSVQAYLQSMVIAGHRWLERSQGGGKPEAAPAALHTFEVDSRAEDEVFKLLSSVMAAFHEAIADKPYAYIQKSIAYIKEHLDQNLSLQQVAKFVHLNPNHFSEVFKRETGLNYIEFVTRERMRRAAEILQESQAKISEVANRVGYEDIKYFSQQFKKHTGQTPSEFRQSVKD